ncbi:predicted protein [Nematostella vectensis]|uniref:Tyrosine-protein kinase catalytic domain-containing protein n=1 Tax=Nematostella vectensis TaxID=45351 RepID=A7RTJ9_NEMVE|nr:predicted protein [Nematostella vectensis]|eukprot:XP_001637340.1 predicted protein [Nematostella vectensis]
MVGSPSYHMDPQWTVPRERIHIMKVIGNGAFGQVHKGRVHGLGTNSPGWTLVAIKSPYEAGEISMIRLKHIAAKFDKKGGGEPYPGIAGKDIPEYLEAGYRMSCPTHLDATLYEIMASCWATCPDMRPTFTSLEKLLNTLEAVQSKVPPYPLSPYQVPPYPLSPYQVPPYPPSPYQDYINLSECFSLRQSRRKETMELTAPTK